MPVNWRPVGPEPEATYWLRRSMVLAAALAVVALASTVFGGSDAPTARPAAEVLAADPSAGPGVDPSVDPGADPTAERTPDPSADPTAAPSTGPTADPGTAPSAEPSASPTVDPDVVPCADDVLDVRVSSDAESYPVGARPALTMTVRNDGAVPCRRALGQADVEIVVTSGADRVWSSDDCAPGGPAGEAVLEPGATETSRVTWPGTRSATSCPKDQPAAQPGTYRLAGRVGDLEVPGATFTLTG